jgi:hypothetical protein
LVTGALKIAGGTQGEILKYLVLNDEEFPKLAVIADTTISFAIDKFADSLSESAKGEKTERASQPPKLPRPVHAEHVLLDALAYDRKMIEQTAVRKIGSAGSPIPNPSCGFPHVERAAGFKR